MPIIARYHGKLVEVTGGFESHGQRMAQIVLSKPVPQYTHGGWAETSTIAVPVASLTDITNTAAECECNGVEKCRHCDGGATSNNSEIPF